MSTSRPLLSIGMIVKNEMRCLKKCLDALAPLRAAIPSELVIADTGSDDGTRELAAEYADVLFDFPWVNDFSAARNAVIERCSGVWHMQVDADEYLDGDSVPWLTGFLGSPEEKDFDLGLVTVRNYVGDEAEGDDYSDFYARRLIRVDSGARYSGAIHETPDNGDIPRAILLNWVILHHDGYSAERVEKKATRNLPLLEQELERNPNNLRCIVQCLESSFAAEDKRKYAFMAVERAREGDLFYWRMLAFHDAIAQTADLLLPELPRWAEEGRTLFPESILVEVGASHGLTRYYHQSGEYEKALKEIDAYFRAAERYDSGDFDEKELLVTSIKTLAKHSRTRIRLIQAECFGKRKRWPEQAEALGKVMPAEYDGNLYSHYLDCLLELWQHGGPGAEELLRRALDSLREEEYVSFARMCRRGFKMPGGQEGAGEPPREKWELFATLGDGCDLGRFGLLMGADNVTEAERLLLTVENLGLMPREALAHAASLGAAVPPRFFRMTAEEIAGLAAGLAEILAEEPERAAALCPKGDDPGRVLWSYTIAYELAGRMDWVRKGSVGFFDFYCDRAEQYIAAFCGETVRREENWNYLPLLTRYAAHCVKARAARNAGDELGYIRSLRGALKAGPGMKNMVNWLLDEARKMADKVKRNASPELLRLAEQVKAILAQYPADHPAVQELKNSPLYQQVAYLIEE